MTDGDLASWEYDQFGTLAFATELDDDAFGASYDQVERDWQAWSPNFTYLIDVAGNPDALAPAAALPMPMLSLRASEGAGVSARSR